MMIFSLDLSASDLFEDVIFHVTTNTQNATEPGLDCSDLSPTDFKVQTGMNGKAIVNSTNFGAASNPNCNFEFSMNGGTISASELQFVQPGIKDAYFYVNGPTANATPLGACPFRVDILPLRGRKMEWKKGKM